jgi:hypothetical protein
LLASPSLLRSTSLLLSLSEVPLCHIVEKEGRKEGGWVSILPPPPPPEGMAARRRRRQPPVAGDVPFYAEQPNATSSIQVGCQAQNGPSHRAAASRLGSGAGTRLAARARCGSLRRDLAALHASRSLAWSVCHCAMPGFPVLFPTLPLCCLFPASPAGLFGTSTRSSGSFSRS